MTSSNNSSDSFEKDMVFYFDLETSKIYKEKLFWVDFKGRKKNIHASNNVFQTNYET